MDKVNNEEKNMEVTEVGHIALNEKRLLDIAEFQLYTSLGRSRATQLAKESGAVFRFGRRLLIDRTKFDAWCNQQ